MAPTHQSAERKRPTARSHRLAVALAAVVIALLAAGCLPEGRRGEGSGPAGSGGLGPAAASSPPAVSSGPTQRLPIVPPTPTPRPTFLVHVVVKGDSLDTIAHRYGTTARSIAFWNRATYPSLDPESARYRPDLLKLGWTLFVIPNDTVDEQDLPDASGASDLPDPSETADAVAADPGDDASVTGDASSSGDAADASARPEDSAILE